MTYNFDPDKWLENEIAFLEERVRKGDMSSQDFDRAVVDLETRHEKMWQRLDGSYRIDHDR